MTEPLTLDALLENGAKLYAQGQSAAAAGVYRQAMAMAPDNPTVRLRHALAIWHGENRADEALVDLLDLQAKYPQAAVHAAVGLVLNSQGRFAEAAQASRRAVTADPLHTTAWLDLATAVDKDAAPATAADLRAVLERGGLRRKHRRDLHFALAVCLRKMGRIEDAFTETQCANGFEVSRWDHDREIDFHTLLKDIFTPDLMDRLQGTGIPDQSMIFITGMPRSGTTLIERMLSAHPDVQSLGETPMVGNLFNQMQSGLGKTAETIRAALTPAVLQQIGEAMVAGAAKRATGKTARLIDKMPANTLFWPFIALMLPNARIIHMRRHPMDTCLSCYEASFSFGLDYASHQVSLGAAYRQYADLTGHWSSLPGNRVLDVSYEALVRDPEAETRRVLTHCALPWDPACAAPGDGGLIKTSSLGQARGAVSTGSIGRWRRLKSRLQPLIRALGGMDWIDSHAAAQDR